MFPLSTLGVVGEGAVETATLSSLLSDIGSVFTSAIGWASTVATTVADNPLLLIGAIVGFVGLGVGLFKRLLHV